MPDPLPPTIAQLDERIKKLEDSIGKLPAGASAEEVKALRDELATLKERKAEAVDQDEVRSFWDF
jgi:predicted  nucleic acid-binding Zn-ribbon protein